MGFSIGSWSFHALYEAGEMTLFGYLESLAHRYHLRHADIWNGMFLSTNASYVRQVALALRREHLRVACLAVDGASIWAPDPEQRARQHRLALRYLEIAAELPVDTVRLDMGVMTPELTEAQFDEVVRRYREYADIAREHGFRVGPQTHQPASLVARNLCRVERALNHPAFGIVLNVSRWPEDKDRQDAAVAPSTMHVQFDRAFVDLLGPALVKKVTLLKANGYKGVWSLEYRGGSSEYLEVALDLAAIRRAVDAP